MDRETWRAAVHGLQPTLSLSMQYPAPGSRHTLICGWYYYIQILQEKEMATYSSSCLENPMDRGAWRATAHGVAKGQTQLRQLSTPNLKRPTPKIL